MNPRKENYDKHMAVSSKSLEELVKEIPPELKEQVRHFVESILKKAPKRGKKLRQDWGGALKNYRGQYTSLELQKKALEWRGD
jgi:gas vesicle protein